MGLKMMDNNNDCVYIEFAFPLRKGLLLIRFFFNGGPHLLLVPSIEAKASVEEEE